MTFKNNIRARERGPHQRSLMDSVLHFCLIIKLPSKYLHISWIEFKLYAFFLSTLFSIPSRNLTKEKYFCKNLRKEEFTLGNFFTVLQRIFSCNELLFATYQLEENWNFKTHFKNKQDALTFQSKDCCKDMLYLEEDF